MAIESGQVNIRIIFNYRDPRDVLVSWYHWLHPSNPKSMHLHMDYMKRVYSNFSSDELINIFIKIDKFRVNEYNPIEHFRLSRVLLFHPNVCKVRFEELIGPEGSGSADLRKQAIKRIFQYIGDYDTDIEYISSVAYDRNSRTFRKGQIGSHKDFLSQEQLSLFNRLHGDIIKQYGYDNDPISEDSFSSE